MHSANMSKFRSFVRSIWAHIFAELSAFNIEMHVQMHNTMFNMDMRTYAHQCKWNWNTITIKHCVHESLESEAQEALLCWWWEMKRIKNKTHENGSGGGGVGIQHRESIELTYNWKRIKCDPLAVLCCAVLHSEFGSMQMEGKEKQHQHQQEYVVKTFFWKNCSCT